ncbi:ranBP-type and C3HC4-type zinc finger-containing protein 1-like [Microplitis mediator]|uniref:ranBP-type and C3HC4-type zinc finger-containing protein 1-like n=1 Tax=Microplitis mediator TaxID=375433 RepID=UPI002555E6B0|nr:ranBP-type and C3HC4-type zinc finger-containing protein 1-like [Microplitis mediator]
MSEINKEPEIINNLNIADNNLIQCEVKADDAIKIDDNTDTKNLEVNLFTEEKSLTLEISEKATVAELKDEAIKRFNVDVNERWVIGRLLTDNDLTTLQALQVSGSISLFKLSSDKDKTKVEDQDEVDAVPNKFAEAESVLEQDLMVIIEGERECFEDGGEAAALPVEFLTTGVNKQKNNCSFSVYSELMKLEECEIVPNSEYFECPICFDYIEPYSGVVLRDCLHVFCWECIKSNVKLNDDVQIKCPFADNEYACDSTLQEREIKALLGAELYEKHLEKSLTHAALEAHDQAFHCRTVDCNGWCLRDEDANHFLCPVCSLTNCLTCQTIHEGRTCFEYQEDIRLSKDTDEVARRTAEKIEEMLRTKEAMECPNCGIVLMKIDGCDGINCSMCKTAICWVTRGPRWGPRGKGDLSGGCRCEKSAPCHPNCRNCH